MDIKYDEIKKNLDRMDRFCHLEIKAINDEERTVEGFASTEDIDRINDVVLASAFKSTLKDYMNNPVLTLMHNIHDIPGHIMDVKIIPGKGLFVKAFIDSTEEVLWTKIKEKTLRAFSVGFKTKKWHTEEKDVNGATVEIRIIEDLELLEIALVSIPMNKMALFSAVKGWENGRSIDIECEGGCKSCGNCLENYKEYMLTELKTAEEIELAENKIWKEDDSEVQFRIKDAGDFKEGSFRQIAVQKEKPRVFGVVGKIKGDKDTTLQSLRFPKRDAWNLIKAKGWVNENSDKIDQIKAESKNIHIIGFIQPNEVILDYKYDNAAEKHEYIVIDSDSIDPGCSTRVFSVSVSSEDNSITLSESEGTYQDTEKVGRSLSNKNKKTLNGIIGNLEQVTSGLKGFMSEFDIQEPEPDKSKTEIESKETESKDKDEEQKRNTIVTDDEVVIEDVTNLLEPQVKITDIPKEELKSILEMTEN